MTLDKYLKEVKQRVDGATEGPFKPHQEYANRWQLLDDKEYPREIAVLYSEPGIVPKQVEKNVVFFAHARTDVPVLLAIVKLLIEQRNWEIKDQHLRDKLEIGLIKQYDEALSFVIPGGEHEG